MGRNNFIENIPSQKSQVTAIFSAQQLPFTMTGRAEFKINVRHSVRSQ
jgi:hypothetical protein